MPEDRVVGMQTKSARPSWKAGSIGTLKAMTPPMAGVTKRMDTTPQHEARQARRAALISSVRSSRPAQTKMALTAMYCVGSCPMARPGVGHRRPTRATVSRPMGSICRRNRSKNPVMV
jgi:hypothetical protein